MITFSASVTSSDVINGIQDVCKKDGTVLGKMMLFIIDVGKAEVMLVLCNLTGC